MLIDIKTYKYFYSIANGDGDYGDFCDNETVVNFVVEQLDKEISIDENSTNDEHNKYNDRYNEMLSNLYDQSLNADFWDVDLEIEL